ncbi:hypothetical protein LXJ56_29855, partial [Escherichia coli]|nr:hypothetical protein [Escherichia coli]
LLDPVEHRVERRAKRVKLVASLGYRHAPRQVTADYRTRSRLDSRKTPAQIGAQYQRTSNADHDHDPKCAYEKAKDGAVDLL